MSRFLDKRYIGLEPYVPGEQPRDRSYVKLNTNESPFKPSPKVVEAISDLEVGKLNLYSDPTAKDLIRAIAENYKVDESNVTVSNGSDEVLAFAFCAFCGKDKPMVCPEVSYGFYPVFCELFSVPYVTVPMRNDLSVDVEGFYGTKGNITIANPNAQTGTFISVDEIEKLVKSRSDDVVIIDEAYVDFGGESCAPLIAKYNNLLVVQTFSKSRSLAGGRVGFAIGNSELIRDIERMKYSFNPYNLNRLSILAGTAAMRDKAYFENCVAAIKSIRSKTVEELKKLGMKVLPSRANFVLAALDGIGGEELYKALKDKGVLVRFLTDKMLSPYIRITIGSQEMMNTLISSIKEIKKERNL